MSTRWLTISIVCLLVLLPGVRLLAAQQDDPRLGSPRPDQAEQLLAMANRARAEAGAGPLVWDAALAAAAMAHCRRMVLESQLEHRYPGELDLASRASHAAARFSVIEENLAEAPTAAELHEAWMNSPAHRTNLLNPAVNRVGIAILARSGELYAVADYAQWVSSLDPAQVEQQVASLVELSGVKVAGGSAAARQACAMEHGLPAGSAATFVMRWQGADLEHLPGALVQRLASGRYHLAEIGSCPAQSLGSPFAAYRLAALLF